MPPNLYIPLQPKDTKEPAFYIGLLNMFISSGWAKRQGLKYAGMAAAMLGTYLANHIHPDDTNLIPTITAGAAAALALGFEFVQSYFATHAAPKAEIVP
jgi:hypothetical protein